MKQKNIQSILILTIIIIILTTIASMGGLLIKGLYRDNTFVTSTWYGTDLVTLVLNTPLIIIALIWIKRGSVGAFLIWLGLIESTLYNYGFYLFASAFNKMFMVYVAIFTLSLWAMIIGLLSLDIPGIQARFGGRIPVKPISIYMIFIGLGLATVYFATWIGFIFNNQVPEMITRTNHPTNIVPALDLSFVIPLFIVGGIWLWRRKPWGYILAVIVNIKGVVYMTGLCAATLSVFIFGASNSLSEMVIWGTIGVCCLIVSILLLRVYKNKPVG